MAAEGGPACAPQPTTGRNYLTVPGGRGSGRAGFFERASARQEASPSRMVRLYRRRLCGAECFGWARKKGGVVLSAYHATQGRRIVQTSVITMPGQSGSCCGKKVRVNQRFSSSECNSSIGHRFRAHRARRVKYPGCGTRIYGHDPARHSKPAPVQLTLNAWCKGLRMGGCDRSSKSRECQDGRFSLTSPSRTDNFRSCRCLGEFRLRRRKELHRCPRESYPVPIRASLQRRFASGV
jgi:hypothetical protein